MADEIKIKDVNSEKILTSGWTIFKENIFSFIAMIVIFFILYLIIGVISATVNSDEVGGSWLIGFLSLAFYNLQFMVIAAYTNDVASGEKRSVLSSITKALKHLLPGVAAGWLAAAATLAGSMALLLPGIYLYIRFMFATIAVVLRDKGALDSLKYSSELIKDRWWDAFGNVLYFGFLIAFPRMFFRLILFFVPKSIGMNIVSYFIEQMFLVFTMILVTLLFLNWDCTQSKFGKGQGEK